MKIGTFSNLQGDYQRIGNQEVSELKYIPQIKEILFCESIYDEETIQRTLKMFKQYYPEILEELNEVASGFNMPIEKLRFIQDAYLSGGGCSLGALKPIDNRDKKMYLFRTYDMDPEITELRFCSTNLEDGYSHTGFSASFFGRSDGMNQHGLCVMFASCGMPVGHYPGMAKPQISGFNFMIVVRLLLEKCQTVQEAVDLFMVLPIASNVNLLIADKNNNIAVCETLNGLKDYSFIEDDHMFITNHAVLDEIKSNEKAILSQSKIREKLLYDSFGDVKTNSKEKIHNLLKTEYPNGITSLNYKESFGTVYSIIFNITDGVIEYSFGSPMFNEIHKIEVGNKVNHENVLVELPNKNYGKDFWNIQFK